MEDILLHYEEALAAEPYNVKVKVQTLCRTGWVELSQFARADELLGEDDGQAK